MDLSTQLQSLLVVSVIAAVSPVLVAVLPGPRVPQVVMFLLGGLIVGPSVLDLAHPREVELLANIGLGFVFLLAGYEVDLRVFRQRAGRRALTAWAVTAALALSVTGVLAGLGVVKAFVPVSLALTTTALGTLLPILQANDMMRGTFGRCMLAAGAVGELLPVIAIAIFLGAKNKFVALASLAVIGLLGLVLSSLSHLVNGTRIGRRLTSGVASTSQFALRWTVVLMLLLLVVTKRFQLDAVLGAFVAGLVLRRWAPAEMEVLEDKINAVGYGFFIPTFFVWSGMSIDVTEIASAPLRLVLFLGLLLLVRGVPALFVYRGVLSTPERVRIMLLTSTTLPLLVALTEIGLRDGTMLPENAAALVGAGVLSVLIFPGLAVALARRSVPDETGGADDGPERPSGATALTDDGRAATLRGRRRRPERA